MNQLERFKKAIEYLKGKAAEATNEGVSRLLRYNTDNYISDVLGGSKPINKQLLKRMVEYSINPEWIETGRGNMLSTSKGPDGVFLSNQNTIILIELKTASGKPFHVKPDGADQIALLNAFLEERDKRIEELSKDKLDLMNLLNSGLGDISKIQKAIFAMVRTGLEYEAAVASRGDKKKEAEMLSSLTKLNHKNLEIDATVENSVALSKSSSGL